MHSSLSGIVWQDWIDFARRAIAIMVILSHLQSRDLPAATL
jgi:hypothetical protein